MELAQVTGGQIAVPGIALRFLEVMPWIIEEEVVGAGIDWPEKQKDLGRRDDIAAMQMRQQCLAERFALGLTGVPLSGAKGGSHDRICTFFRTGLSSPRNPSTTVAPLVLTFDPRTKSRLSASA